MVSSDVEIIVGIIIGFSLMSATVRHFLTNLMSKHIAITLLILFATATVVASHDDSRTTAIRVALCASITAVGVLWFRKKQTKIKQH